jgi:hypothetical protein
MNNRRASTIGLALVSLSAAGCRHLEPLSAAASHVAAPIGDRCSWEARRADGTCDLYDVTIAELLVAPEVFHGKRTRVRGFVTLTFEGNTLCDTDTPAAACLWIDVEGLKDPGFREGWVEVEARFDGEERGHMGCCRAALSQLSRLVRLR